MQKTGGNRVSSLVRVFQQKFIPHHQVRCNQEGRDFMGCLRLGFSFIVSLFAAAIFTIVGIFIGSFVYSFTTVHGTPSPDLSSPLAFVQANAPGASIGGSIGAIIGLFVLIAAMKRASDINWLKRYGTRIVATVTEIEQKRRSRQVASMSGDQTSYRTEWYTVYVIVARWVDPRTKLLYSFTSPDLQFSPRRFYQGCGIEVLIDPNNMKRYYMEI
jgi:hypothetical protein